MKKEVAVITGAGSGIGRAVSLRLAERGLRVVVVDLDPKGGEETVSLIKEMNGEGFFIRADISRNEEVENYVSVSKEEYGRIDVFFNNAAILQPPALLADTSEDIFDRIMAVNLKGAFLGMKHILKVMEDQKSGVIINTSSMGGIHSTPYLGVYAAAKHGVVGLTRTAAVEYGPMGIRVNAICPGGVATNMTKHLDMHDPKQNGPLGKPATPEEIANVVNFLASDESSYMNGSIVTIDGGLTS